MNQAGGDSFEAAPAKLPGNGGPFFQPAWSWRKVFFLIALAFIFHLALIYFFGAKKQIVPRAVKNAPRLQLADSADELIALDDPAMFALPHPNDFGSVVWLKTPAVTNTIFRWSEPPQWLPLDAQKLGTIFSQFVETNRFAEIRLDLKPQLNLAASVSADESTLPQDSTLKIFGALARLGLKYPVSLPSLPSDNVIPASKIQLLVDRTGTVISAVLLPDNNGFDPVEHNDAADQRALEISRSLRFHPAAQLTLGEIIFNWHAVPLISTNTLTNP